MQLHVPVTARFPVPAHAAPISGPAIAGVMRRFSVWLVDTLAVMVPGMALIVVAISDIADNLPSTAAGLAAVFGFSWVVGLFTHGGPHPGDLRAAAAAEWMSLAVPLVLACLAVPVLQWLYHASLLAWRRRTLGMMVAGVRVVPVAQFRRAVAAATPDARPTPVPAVGSARGAAVGPT